MAKPEYEQFVSEVLSGVDAEKQAAIKAALLDESLVGKLQDGFYRQSDYSRSKDALAKRQAEIDAFLATEKDKVDRWAVAYEEAITESARAKELADKYRATYGDLKDGTPMAGMRKEDIEALLESKIGKERGALSSWTIDAVDKLTDLKLSHREQFGTTLNTKELSDFAAKHNIADLGIAYKAFVEPQVEAKREEAFKAKMAEAVKQAKEEAKREAIAERFPAGGGSRGIYSEVPKDAIVADKHDRIRGAAAELETLMAGLNR